MASALETSQYSQFSIKLWPPSQKTRFLLVERMIKNLTTPSLFSRKFGLLSKEEAEEDAKHIETIAFSAASQHYEQAPDGDGSAAVQLYAKESSKMMLEVLKRGPKPSEDGDVAVTPDTFSPTRGSLFDISGGRRAFIDADEASELLKPLTEPGNDFTRICFSNRSFGLDATRVAEPILSKLKSQVIEVDLSDFVAGRPEAEALEVMNIFSSALEGCELRYLNLSNNALGEKGVRAFGSLLNSQSNLEELYLINDGISEEAARAVSELIPSTEKLKVLHFHNNMTGDDGAIAISKLVKCSPILEDFRCSSTRIGAEGGVALAEALSSCPNLKKLDLRDNMFGVEAGIAVSKTLYTFTNLIEVYLSYLNLEDKGGEAILSALKDSSPLLEVLELAGNEITSKSAMPLAVCLATKQSLKKLSLGENELKDEGTIVIAKALEHGHDELEEVDMSSNAIRRAGARVLAHAMIGKKKLKQLNINGNFISEEGVDEVNEIFKHSTELLGPLDDNDPEGEDADEDDSEGDGDKSANLSEDVQEDVEDADDLESRVKDLALKQEN